jgi:hypothetical protein
MNSAIEYERSLRGCAWLRLTQNLWSLLTFQNDAISMLSIVKVAALGFLFTAAATASAAEICKSTDEKGNVTFSDCQAVDSDSTRIEVSEGPTDAEILEAKERAKQAIDAYDEIIGAPDSPATVADVPITSPVESAPHMPATGTKIRLSREQLDVQQRALDEQCQIAREKILSVERAQYVEECIQDGSRGARKECERFYADYGDATESRPQLHLDLPECVEAYEFQRNRSGWSIPD